MYKYKSCFAGKKYFGLLLSLKIMLCVIIVLTLNVAIGYLLFTLHFQFDIYLLLLCIISRNSLR